ncbi:MAG: sigma-54 dependent transcriptional regulator [Salibacteraceae bacterium]
MAKILVIDDDADICTLLSGFLERKGFSVDFAYTAKKGLQKLKDSDFDLVLCDFRLPDAEGMEVLNTIREQHPCTRVIVITGYSDVKIAVNCIRKGAIDYVTKPLHPEEILHSVERGLEVSPVSAGTPATDAAKPPKSGKGRTASHEPDFVEGCSPQSKQVRKLIELVGPTEMSVVITGETGTGKEYIARAIHNISPRKDKPFVAIDCGALPKEIAQSELFGHKKGSFTGALADKTGSFELANGGTLFLDEIANLSYDNQVKLLRVLQERSIRPIGSNQDVQIDVRIIAATNEDLWRKARAGEFREDLYHRLNEFSIQLAPLRERKEEIMQFTEYFIETSNRELNREVNGVTATAREKLENYYWHGNLRELRNVVKRAVLMASEGEIDTIHLPLEIVNALPPEEQDAVHGANGALFSIEGTLREVAERAERQAIIAALKKTNFNKSKTAELLAVDRKTLYNKINAYGISLKR